MEEKIKDEEKYKKAKKRVEEIKGFYAHLFSYIGVNIVLIVIDVVTGPWNWWFYWVTVFWGIGVFWHFMGVFVFHKITGSSWEEKKIKEIMDGMDSKEKDKKQ
ncbi:MAG: 2TM domain-containing protein [Actinomycetota bacterium]|nr:2TM domain-containing protein [Actinomycetota bacterium]